MKEHRAISHPQVDIGVPLSGLCLVRDFAPMHEWLAMASPASEEGQPGQGFEYRKHWEVAQALRALAAGRLLRDDTSILGIGAGNEPTLFTLTNFVGRVFATDLYLSEGWEESANIDLLRDPDKAWEGDWNPRRLVVQHMDARALRFEDASMDGAFSSSSIEHYGGYGDVTQSMREAFRVLKPGGVYALSTEFKISGPGAGLPGILMFTWEEIQEHIIGSAPWEVMDPADIFRQAQVEDPVASFELAAAALREHVRTYGSIRWDRLRWPEYPHVRLEHQGMVWTSVHLALRKPEATAS